MLTVETLLQRETDGVLLDIQQEILSGCVPATGAAHDYCRKINKMIDAGECCINPTTYRKVYLPTLAKSVQREMASRFVKILKGEDYVTRQHHEPTQDDLNARFNPF
jgi:hypothetical protein